MSLIVIIGALIVVAVFVAVIVLVVVLIVKAASSKQPEPESAAGWYPDPGDPWLVRYFDGRTWTSATQPRSR